MFAPATTSLVSKSRARRLILEYEGIIESLTSLIILAKSSGSIGLYTFDFQRSYKGVFGITAVG